MNTTQKIRLQLLLSAMLFLTIAPKCLGQNGPAPELLLGVWTFNETASVAKMPAHIQQDLQSSADLQQHVATYYTGRQMQFMADGSFALAFANGQVFTGQWSLSGNLLTTVTNGGATATQQLVFLDAQNFYLIAQQYNGPDAELMFPELYFVKN